MIVIYGYPNTRALRITWLLAELSAPYDYHLVDLMKGDLQSADYLAVNPAGKIPALKDGDFICTESVAIMAYLCDKFAKNRLIPTVGTIQRAKYNQWTSFVISELEQPLWTIGKHTFALPKKYRLKEVIPTAEWEFQSALALLSQGLGQKEYILGDSFSAADVLIGHTLLWGTFFKQTIEHKNLQDYMQRLMARPALKQAQAKENASINKS